MNEDALKIKVVRNRVRNNEGDWGPKF